MDSIDQYNEEYQARLERAERTRKTMWQNHDNVVSALTGRELTHEEARQIAALKCAVDHGHPAIIQHTAKVLCEMFDDSVFEYVSDQLEM